MNAKELEAIEKKIDHLLESTTAEELSEWLLKKRYALPKTVKVKEDGVTLLEDKGECSCAGNVEYCHGCNSYHYHTNEYKDVEGNDITETEWELNKAKKEIELLVADKKVQAEKHIDRLDWIARQQETIAKQKEVIERMTEFFNDNSPLDIQLMFKNMLKELISQHKNKQ